MGLTHPLLVRWPALGGPQAVLGVGAPLFANCPLLSCPLHFLETGCLLVICSHPQVGFLLFLFLNICSTERSCWTHGCWWCRMRCWLDDWTVSFRPFLRLRCVTLPNQLTSFMHCFLLGETETFVLLIYSEFIGRIR